MIDHKNIEVKRGEYGMWMHPAFPWQDIPEEANIKPFIAEWGYEACFQSLEDDASDDIAERYAESNDPDCSYWTPTKPKGDGWILGAIYDTEDSPVACWMRPLSSHP